MAFSLQFDTIIKFALGLIFAMAIIYLLVSGLFGQGKYFIESISMEKRCEQRTAFEYENFIKGYHSQGEQYYVLELCERFERCNYLEFKAFKEKQPKYCKGMVNI